MKRKEWIKIRSCMWIYTKEVLTRGPMLNLEMEECLKKRIMSVMLCTNTVCASIFEDHEWVSESTITQHAEEVRGKKLDHEIGLTCVVQWSMLWSAMPPTRLNGTLENKI